MAGAGGTVVAAELGGVEPENVPGLGVELGLVLAAVSGVTELEVGSLGRVVGEVEGVDVGDKPPLPLPPDKPDDREGLLPRPAPDEPEVPADVGAEVGDKLRFRLPPTGPRTSKSYCRPGRPRRSPTYPRLPTTGWKWARSCWSRSPRTSPRTSKSYCRPGRPRRSPTYPRLPTTGWKWARSCWSRSPG